HYMAPEQVEKPLAVDHRADIYSLGVVFYELLTGELPLGRFPPPSRRVQVDVRLDEVVLRALERDPTCRYQQGSEVKCAVDSLAQAPLSGPAGEKRGKNALAADLAALAAITLSLPLLALCAWWLESAYMVFGVPLLAQFTCSVPWGSALKLYAGHLLAVGGVVVFVIAGRPTNFEPLWVFGVAGGWTFALLMQLFDQGGQK